MRASRLYLLIALCVVTTFMQGQSVPQVIRYSGTTSTHAHQGGTAGVVFAIYAQREGGAPLWQEVQNVAIDGQGRYSVALGAFSKEGVPASIFSSGEARWLGVSINGGREETRQQLVSVPYAMKSKDADTLNGLSAAQIVAQANAGTSVQSAAPVAKTSSSTTTTAAPQSGSLINSSVINTTATDFTDTNSTQVVNVLQSGTGAAVKATSASATTNTLQGINTSTTGSVRGVYGEANSTSTSAAGVYGISKGATGVNYGVLGITNSSSGTALNGTATSATGATIGLRGQANSSLGTGVQGAASSVTGNTMGVNGFVLSPTGVAGVFDNRAGGEILSLRNNGTEEASVDGSGNVFATSFAGDGSALTAVNAATLGGLANTAFVQGVTTTAGSGLSVNTSLGVATVKLITTCSAGDVLRYNGSTWVCDSNLQKRNITFVIGCETCGTLQDTDDQPQVWINTSSAMTITSIACYSDVASAPSINVQRDDGSAADIMTSAIVCQPAGTSSNSFNVGETVLNVGDKLNFTMVTAGSSHRVTVSISATVN